jgi:hypothetical protein
MKTRLWCLSTLLAVSAPLLVAQGWPQWALNAQHNTQVGIAGQSLNQNIVNIVYDPLVPQEQALNDGDLLAHYQAPLVEGDDVYMMFKSGTYTLESYATQNWGETKYTWNAPHTALNVAWQFSTDYKAPGSAFDFWEPVFHPALANGVLYVPGAFGTVWKVNKATGTGTRINPFNNLSSSRFVTSPLTVDSSGRILYTVVQLKNNTPDWFADDVVDSFLVRISPNDSVEKVSWSAITVGTPAGNAQCLNAFSESQTPWPPSPTAVPPSVTCGSQRPGVNASPAVAPDGTIYLISRAHLISRWGYLVAVNSNLTQKWVSSLRDRFSDGCGVSVAMGGSLPANGAPGGCRTGANLGVDPATNGPGGGRVLDDSSSTPVVAPDGSIFYGAYTRYNYAQGHLMHFASNGSYIGAYRFGWDESPGIYSHGGTYSVDIKDNQYGGVGSYCNTASACPPDRTATNPAYPEAYFITQLNHNLNTEWRFQNTNTLSCSRDANGNVTCVSDHPAGFEWCVNAFVVDSNGTLFANSEDGNLFAILQGGTLRDKIFQQLALGAAYTPTSIGSDGRIYSQNAGHLFVAGN